MSQFIFDSLTGIPTILAVARSNRPNEYAATSDACVFCKGNEHLNTATIYMDVKDWNVRVVPNKYPFADDHEIIIHSADHYKDIENLPHADVVKLINTYLNRTRYFTALGKEVFIFNNRGVHAGASLVHAHSQLIALEAFPGVIKEEKDRALVYFNKNKSCYWCDLLQAEVPEKQRVVYESGNFVLLVPQACRWSYEMLLLPKFHRSDFGQINEAEIADFASVLALALKAYNSLFKRPDRNFWFHSLTKDPYHWHVDFLPHIKFIGGLEWGAGIWVSDKATPEEAAIQLRNAVI